MASLNKVFLAGNLTRAAELRYTPGGMAVCEFGIAINRRFSSNEQTREEVCFVDIVVWGKQAESCGRFLEKGSGVLIEGRLQLDQWEDRESGAKRSKMRVVAERVQFLSRSDGKDGDFPSPPPSQGGYRNNGGGNYNRQSSGPSQSEPQNNNRGPQSQSRSRQYDQVPKNDAKNQLDNPFTMNDDDVEDDIPF